MQEKDIKNGLPKPLAAAEYDALLEQYRRNHSVFQARMRAHYHFAELQKKMAAQRYVNLNNDELLLTAFEKAFTQKGGRLFYASGKAEAQGFITRLLNDHSLDSIAVDDSAIVKEISENSTFSLHPQSSLLKSEFQEDTSVLLVSRALVLLSETGSVVCCSSENAPQFESMPELFVVGIEDIVPGLAEAETLMKIHTLSHLAEDVVPVVISGNNIKDGKNVFSNLFVIVVDNGRTELLKEPLIREALHCIKCKACLYVCPVFQVCGEQDVIGGPIGLIKKAYAGGDSELAYACTMCNACKEVCPTGIPLPSMIQRIRELDAESGNKRWKQRNAERMYLKFLRNHKRMNRIGKTMANIGLRFFYPGFSNLFGLPRFARKSFTTEWLKSRGEGH